MKLHNLQLADGSYFYVGDSGPFGKFAVLMNKEGYAEVRASNLPSGVRYATCAPYERQDLFEALLCLVDEPELTAAALEGRRMRNN